MYYDSASVVHQHCRVVLLYFVDVPLDWSMCYGSATVVHQNVRLVLLLSIDVPRDWSMCNDSATVVHQHCRVVLLYFVDVPLDWSMCYGSATVVHQNMRLVLLLSTDVPRDWSMCYDSATVVHQNVRLVPLFSIDAPWKWFMCYDSTAVVPPQHNQIAKWYNCIFVMYLTIGLHATTAQLQHCRSTSAAICKNRIAPDVLLLYLEIGQIASNVHQAYVGSASKKVDVPPDYAACYSSATSSTSKDPTCYYHATVVLL